MNPEQLLDRFSTHLKNTVARAMALVASLEQAEVTPAHLLLVLMEEEGAIGMEILKKFKVRTDALYHWLNTAPQVRNPKGKILLATMPALNQFARRALEKAMLVAYERGHNHVGTEHLLLGLVNCDDKQIEEILQHFHISKETIIAQVESVLQSASNFPDTDEVASMMNQLEDIFSSENNSPVSPHGPLPKFKKNNNSILEIFTTNLTDKKIQKNIDPVIGRKKEIERLIHILSRRTKNNPVLVGEPGVGKTALVEGLAKKISEGKVPAVLRDKKVLALDMTLLVAGTIYRGEFEARLKQIIDEISKSPNIILFIDELHNIIGAGSSQGAMDAANILKPALARGNLRCIGATTIEEYKKHVASDPALERRFQSVLVEEPSAEETILILQGIKKYYENFHNVRITDEAIGAAVELSGRYIHDNFQPDKAIDLIDEASAAVRVNIKPTLLQEKREKLRAEWEKLQTEKEAAIGSEQFERAIAEKKKIQEIEKKITVIEDQLKRGKKMPLKKVMKQHIIQVLANRLNIEEKILAADAWQELETLPERLKKHILGQEEVLTRVAKTLKQAQLQLTARKKPFASFLFAGPSGVGKTELAKVLAQELFHDNKALIKLDMSEFSESHSTSKLLGSPAGYIGHKERNHFTDEIRQRPYCVVLFDEIDKAHRDVVKLLLQILDEGELTDSSGKKTYFRHTVIILTTNLGAELFKSAGIGFGKGEKENKEERERGLLAKLKEELSSALLSRLNAVITFSPLSKENVQAIIAKNLADMSAQLENNKQFTVKADAEALTAMAETAFNVEEGARLVERVLQDIMRDLLIKIVQNEQHKNSYVLKKKNNEYCLV